MLRLSAADWDQFSLNLARYSAVAFGMCMLAILSGVHRLWVERHLTPLTAVWFLFGCLMFASAIVNSSASEAFGGLWCLAGVPVVCFAAIPRIIRRYGLSILPITIILGDLPYIAASLFHPGTTISATVANEFTEATSDLHLSGLIELGLVLFFLTVLLNGVARLLILSTTRRGTQHP